MATYKTYPGEHGGRSFFRRLLPTTPPPAKEQTVMTPESDGLLTFGLLPEGKRNYGSFSISIVINLAILLAAILFTLARVHEVMLPVQPTALVYVAPPKPIAPPPVMHMVAPPPVPHVEPKPILPPAPVKVQAPKPAPVMHKAAPKPQPAPAPKPRVIPHVEPKPKVGLFATATAMTHRIEHEAVHLGSFGSPEGAHQNQQQRTVAVVGAFGQPSANRNDPRFAHVRNVSFGSSESASQNSFHGRVNTSGFGSSAFAGHSNTGTAHVSQPSFGGGMFGGHGSQLAAAKLLTTPIVVLAKPLPQYTALARAHHIQGDVLLRVRFNADGRVEVLGVVQSLPEGLDQQAIAAAERIRFRPATRGGHPVSVVDIIRISFQMT